MTSGVVRRIEAKADAWIKRQPWWLPVDLWLGRKAIEWQAKADFHRQRLEADAPEHSDETED